MGFIDLIDPLADVASIEGNVLIGLVQREAVLAVDGADNGRRSHFDGLIQVHPVWNVSEGVC